MTKASIYSCFVFLRCPTAWQLVCASDKQRAVQMRFGFLVHTATQPAKAQTGDVAWFSLPPTSNQCQWHPAQWFPGQITSEEHITNFLCVWQKKKDICLASSNLRNAFCRANNFILINWEGNKLTTKSKKKKKILLSYGFFFSFERLLSSFSLQGRRKE